MYEITIFIHADPKFQVKVMIIMNCKGHAKSFSEQYLLLSGLFLYVISYIATFSNDIDVISLHVH